MGKTSLSISFLQLHWEITSRSSPMLPYSLLKTKTRTYRLFISSLSLVTAGGCLGSGGIRGLQRAMKSQPVTVGRSVLLSVLYLFSSPPLALVVGGVRRVANTLAQTSDPLSDVYPLYFVEY